jgi:hypothetical protein
VSIGFDGILAVVADYEAAMEKLLTSPGEPPESEPERVLVVAGNRAEYEAWCWDHHIRPGDPRAIELYEPWRVRGLARGFPYTVTGTWQRRRDLPALEAMLRSREARLLSEVTPWGCRTTDGPAHSPTRIATAKPSS